MVSKCCTSFTPSAIFERFWNLRSQMNSRGAVFLELRETAAMITLTLKEQPVVPLEAEAITPDVTKDLGHDAIRALPVFLGKRQCRLDDFFEVDGAASEHIEVRGD